jgi:hypothetical protein
MAHAAEQQRARQDRRVLAVVLGEHSHSPDLERYMAETDVAELRVVAPTQVDALHWYATDEKEATADADRRVRSVERDVGPQVESVTTEAGDLDPVQAVEDAMASFSPDEIVLVGDRADDALEDSLQRFGLPVRRLGLARLDRPRGRARELGRGIMSGRSAATPYAVFLGAMAFLGAVVLTVFVIWLVVTELA